MSQMHRRIAAVAAVPAEVVLAALDAAGFRPPLLLYLRKLQCHSSIVWICNRNVNVSPYMRKKVELWIDHKKAVIVFFYWRRGRNKSNKIECCKTDTTHCC
jgi:hypothetical protein